jgi:Tol biopolymer transport system component
MVTMRRLVVVITASAVLSSVVSAASARNEALPEPSGRIAFSVRFWPKNAGDNWEIFLMKVSGGSSVNLTRYPRCSEVTPAWSHDGQWVSFGCAGHLGGRGGIYVIRTSGAGRRAVIRLPKGNVDDPAWAPMTRNSPSPMREPEAIREAGESES